MPVILDIIRALNEMLKYALESETGHRYNVTITPDYSTTMWNIVMYDCGDSFTRRFMLANNMLYEMNLYDICNIIIGNRGKSEPMEIDYCIEVMQKALGKCS